MKVLIMRGLPGSGKSTWVRNYWNSMDPGTYPLVCSADDYHMVDDEYRYDPKKAGAAHTECLRKFLNGLQGERYDSIIVDNTNTTAAEIAPYYRLAEMFGVETKIVRVCCDLQLAMSRQTHAVPESTIFTMWQNLNSERLPAYWKEEFFWG